MTERFTITQDFEEHHRQIRDNGKIIMGCFVEPQAEPIVKLLNELHDEKEQLKLQNQRLDIDIMNNQLAYYDLKKENKQLKEDLNEYCNFNLHTILDKKNKEIEKLKSICQDHRDHAIDFKADCMRLEKENEKLKSENKRLTDKLNKTALELVDECISQGKATEISEMSYKEFLDYRAENGKPMELQL